MKTANSAACCSPPTVHTRTAKAFRARPGTVLASLWRALVAGFCIAVLLTPPPARPCAGSRVPACALAASPCLKTLSLGKGAATGAGLVTFAGGALPPLVFTLTAVCPSCPTTPCATPATPTAATLSMAFHFLADFAVFPPPPCPPVPPGPVVFAYPATPAPVPACSAAGAFTTYTVPTAGTFPPLTVPLGITEGYYCVYGTVTVTYSDGTTLSASGDTVICVVPPVPGQPGVPRLSVTLLSESNPRAAAGDMAVARYSVRNHDPSNAVVITGFAGSRQSAVRPQGGNERQGVYAISNPFGDDFPIMFNPGSNCIPLPAHPYTQPALSNALGTLGPGQSNVVTVGVRSYGQCGSGSCSESTVVVVGTYPGGVRTAAAAGMSLIVDNSRPSSPCARAVNDCNNNGIPDAIDIDNGISQDRNYNAMPDECEEFLNLPGSTSVQPPSSPPNAPIVVRVAFSETVPMVNVWANGSPMTRNGPFWQGTIPADRRPGPQTVYFIGKDQLGGMTTQIATYDVVNPPIIVNVPQGFSTIADNLLATPNNQLGTVIPNPAEDTQIHKWQPASQTYDTYIFFGGLWVDGATGEPANATLLPGEGAWIFSPIPQTITFRGAVGPAGPQPRRPPGTYFVSCRTPQPCTFEEMMGFPPIVGDRVLKYDNITPSLPNQPSSTHTFTAAGWSPSAPALAVAKAAFVELVSPGQPPTITQQPQSQTVVQGQTATFAVAATGTAPLSYQWRFNGANIAGANSPTFAVPNAQPANAGNYNVVVGNPFGSATSAVAVLTVQVPTVAEVFSPTGNLTPPNAVYASPVAAAPVSFPNGLVIRNISHGRLRFHPPPPALNGSQIYSSDADVRFELSVNGGSTFTPITSPADVAVRQITTADDGTTRAFQTEMLSLNIAGGGLPAGVRVRESPTLVSPGQATSRLVPTGGAMVSSVFDVRLEVSLNSGATWTPGGTPARVVLGIESPENLSVTANPTPPTAVYASPNPLLVSSNQNGTRIRAVTHGRLRLHPPPPPLGSNILYTSDGEVRLQLSQPGSAAFSNVVAPATVTVRMSQVKDDGTSLFFDTEMLSLDIAGGTLPANVRLRESPTRLSPGRATARFVRGGGAQVSSFFNVELEGSINSGGTFQPFTTPVRIELALEAPENLSPSANPTPPNFSFNTPLNPSVVSNSLGFLIRRVWHRRLILHPPPPPIGGFLNYTSTSTAIIEFSRDGGQTFSNATVNGDVAVRMTGVKNDGDSLFFDTEMLSLNLAGGTLPAGFRLRESPARASLGRSTARFVENGAALVSSFFDVDLDVSANNGTTYVANSAPIRVELTAEAPENESPSDNLTPVNGAYISAVNAPSINFGLGVFTRDYLHFRLALHPPIPLINGSLVYTSTSLARFQVSLDGERTYQDVTANALTAVRMTRATDLGPTKFFDTEMLQLDFFGGTLPNNVRIRLTPGRPQRGQASIRLLNPEPAPPGLGPQPVWGLSSHFDLTTDISTDGGASWRTATASQRVFLDSRSPQNFSPTDNLTPPNAAYVSLANTPPIVYTNGIITRRYRHFRLLRHPPRPIDPIGPILWTSPGLAEFQVSLNGGGTWLDVRAQADTTVRMTPIGTTEPEPQPYANSTIQHFETEITRLDIFGGNLPAGVRLRLNPNMPSRGGATVQRTGGGYNLSSFLDINTQLSLNNGATWHNSKSDSRVVLDSGGPENFSMTGNLTPLNSAYVSAPAAPAIRFLNGLQTRDYVHFRLQLHPPLPILGSSLVYTSGGLADFCISVNGGTSFVPVRANAQTRVRMTHSADADDPQPDPWKTQIFETEMLQLDIFGGSLPAGTRIRVSPTRPSRGQATVEQVDGGYRVSSFFDLWTDLSVDGGQTWSPSINMQRVSLDGRAPESKVPAPDLTPANSAYVSLANAPAIIYPGNIITRNYIHGRLRPHPVPPPPLGSNIVYATPGVAQFQVSLDGGRSFTDVSADATTVVRMSHVADDPSPQPNLPVSYFENEMLRLDIFGGNLPAGVRLRVSPTLPSRGQAVIQRIQFFGPGSEPFIGGVPSDWDLVSSFFDINTELSTDNGQTWRPAINAQRVVLDNRAPEGLYTDNRLPPPNVSYDTPVEAAPLRYGLDRIITRHYRHRILTNIIVPPPIGTGVVYTTAGSELVFDVSTDGGSNFMTARVTADMSLRLTHTADESGIQHYDTELLSLNFTGGQLPPGVLFRESPTRRSLGQTTIRPVVELPGQRPPPPSCENISSFFNIWTEVSINGGQTWLPADGPARVVAVAPPPKSFFPSDLLPPPGGRYVNPFRRHQDYPGGFSVRNARHRLFLNSLPPPPLGVSATHSFGSTVDMEISIDGGRTFSAVSAPADVAVQDTHTQDVGPNQYYATEIQQLNIAGGSLPPNVRMRESPRRASIGQTIICPNRGGAGGYQISSYFDVWTDLSTDGGQTWVSASSPVRVELTRECEDILVAGTVWKYLDNGSDQGTAWRNIAFNDSAWASGPAELGYGDGDEMTVVNGGDPTNRLVTTYFRRAFSLPDVSGISALTLRVKRDDGVIVYLNGTEVFRDNLPAGPVTFNTLAALAGDDGMTFLNAGIDPSMLVNGVNVLAAEIHQNAINSSDISFDLELLANPVLSVAPTVVVTSPASNAVITTPGMSAPVTYAASASVADPCAGITAVQFYVNGVLVATDTTAPYTVTVDEPLGTYSVTARAFANNGTSANSAPVPFRVVMIAPVVAAGGVWKYLDNGSDQGTAWTAPGFNDTTWASGPAELGYGDGGEATVVGFGPDANNKYITTYFRHAFNVADASTFTELIFGVVRDDGVVVYLNGAELFRMNMPTGAVNAATLALVAVAGADEAAFFPATVPIPSGLLRNAANVLAAEIHQNTNTSSDISFNLFMDGVKGRPSCGPLTISRQGNLLTIRWPGEGTLEVAGEITGPWVPLPNATSPHVTPATVARSFFRLRCPVPTPLTP